MASNAKNSSLAEPDRSGGGGGGGGGGERSARLKNSGCVTVKKLYG